MPYFDPAKPYVNNWFSATKRSLSDCAATQALARLRKEHGLTVLYQYLHRYADAYSLRLDHGFRSSIDCIVDAGDILVAPANTMMRRLRLLQGIFICRSGNSYWALNMNAEDSIGVQLAIVGEADTRLTLPPLPANSLRRLELPDGLRLTGRHCVELNRRRVAALQLPFGTLSINCSESSLTLKNRTILPAMSWQYADKLSSEHRPLSAISRSEEYRLLTAQSAIILREILFCKRQMNTRAYLQDGSDVLLYQENW